MVNFQEEPTKSQRQVLRLLNLFETHVQTQSQYLKHVNRVMDEEAEDMVVPALDKAEVAAILSQDAEDRAKLLFHTFHRLTSVLYDT